MSEDPAVAMSHICKRFGELQANDEVSLRVARGTVHGIVGENGAGKSTLMSILYGFYQADSGEIAIDGQPVRIRHSKDAIALGIGMVHQHFMLVETFTALDNVLLGAEPGWRLKPARDKVRGELQALMRETGLAVRLDSVVEELPVGERQRLEILKALYRGARILILDEPTAVLTPAETESLFATLAALRQRGTTLLLITHKLKEVAALCDRVTVMRGGRVVLDKAMAETSLDGLAEAMVGRRVQLGRGEGPSPVAPEEADAPLLAGRDLRCRDEHGTERLGGVSLVLRPGEIVGIAGVSGNGQSELLDVLAGLTTPVAGRLELGGQRFEPGRWLDPRRARWLGLAHVPEDRHRRGLVLGLPAWESAVLGYHRLARYARGGLLRRRRMRSDTERMMADYDVRPRAPDLKSAKFSGGNQQKLVLAREALHRPTVLLVGQPTRGVDIGAIEFIHGRLRAMRDAGGAVLIVSSELDEILALADRVIVMSGGRIAGELPIAACNEATLGRLMAGVRD
ncbi:ABC transporter ATP-binding protein [Ideonella sp. YS5]|uniref:ABC transporter ATP-binding protein n=1 Tax=Ideonella sp. YS5 TaxID=3453714 RepID=UPI003EE851CA